MICVAADIGASNGRLVAGCLDKNKLRLTELHRFENAVIRRNDGLFWDVDRIFNEILYGLSLLDKAPASIGVDTWAVDYALLDAGGNLACDVFAYRDSRTAGVSERFDSKALYNRTGIRPMPFNTLFQLIAHKDKHASRFLMIPDYLHYRLCGVAVCEHTNAGTTQMLNPETGLWDDALIAETGFERGIFPEIVKPGTILGVMTTRPDVKVIAPASHDTASAVAAVPAFGNNRAYISSGTWSLMGIESDCIRLDNPLFTNEIGVAGRYRVLKNIMGLWLVQEIKRLLPENYSYETLSALAETPFGPVIHPNDERFFSPGNMISEIRNACLEQGSRAPETAGELVRCALDSLSLSYAETLRELRAYTDIDRLHIIGGGARNKLLNRLCARAAGIPVVSGPFEASAVGNILTQLIALGELKDLSEARALVADSFDLEEFTYECI